MGESWVGARPVPGGLTSSSVSYGMMHSTGPKISSCAIVIEFLTFLNTVGATKYPVLRWAGIAVPAHDERETKERK